MVVTFDCEGVITFCRETDISDISIATLPEQMHLLSRYLGAICRVKDYIGAKGVMAFTENCCRYRDYFMSDCFDRYKISPKVNRGGDICYWNSINQPDPSVFPASAAVTSSIRYFEIASLTRDSLTSPDWASSANVATTIDSASTLK